jgi:amino acid transporter
MIAEPLFAAAGLAELSPEEARNLEHTLLLTAAIPFIVHCVCVVVFLIVFFRKPSRRQQLNGRVALDLAILLATIGCVLLVPTLPFLSPLIPL